MIPSYFKKKEKKKRVKIKLKNFHNLAKDPVRGIFVANVKRPSVCVCVCGGQITRETRIRILKGIWGFQIISKTQVFDKINQANADGLCLLIYPGCCTCAEIRKLSHAHTLNGRAHRK